MAQITSGSLTIVDVTDGAPGLNNTTVFLYRRAVSAPNKPTGNLTYTFSTASITGALEGWVQSINELTGSNPIWMIAAIASSNGETDVIESSEWAGPIKMAQNGQDGQPGSQGASVATTRELYYLKTNSTDPAQITNANQIHTTDDVNQWTSVVPTYIGSGKYYTCIETTLSNGNVVWSAPAENKGLTDANVNVANAIEIARGVKQHFFWVATDKSENIPAGAYIAEESEESFYSSPTKGNILTRSDGIWIRNGVDKLATLQGSGLTFLVPTGTYKGQKSVSLNGSGLTFYNIGSSNSAAATLASDGLQIENGSIILGGHGTSGTNAGDVTLSNKNFTRSINGTSHNDLRFAIGSKFGVASDGTLYATGGVFNNYSTTTQMNTAIGNAVDGIEVGGRNLHKESASFGSAWNYDTGASRNGEVVTITRGTTGETRIYQMPANGYWTWEPNTEYVVSIEAKGNAGGEALAMLCNGGVQTYHDAESTLTTSWKRYIRGFKTASSVTTGSMTYLLMTDNSTIQLRKPKLEKGTKPTDWTPAPEDVQEEIDAKKSTFTINATGTDASQGYAQILAWAQEGKQLTWTVDSTAGIKVGDTVRIKTTVANMSNAPVYVVTTCRETPTSSTSIKTTSHGLDTTIIDGGNILTNSIGANKIKVGEINIGAAQITSGTIDTARIPDLSADKITSGTINIGQIPEDAKNANVYAHAGYRYTKDIVIYGESNKYYPVYFNNNQDEYDQNTPHQILIFRTYSEQAPADWNTSTHKGGLTLAIKWNYGGWGGATYNSEILDFSEMYSTMVGDVQVGSKSGMLSAVFLRGGGSTGALYHIYSDITLETTRYGSATFPIIGLTAGATIMTSGTYSWTVDAALTTPNTTHLNELIAANTAANYLYADSNGLRIASASPSSQNQRIHLTSSQVSMYSSDGQKRMSLDSSTGVVVGRSDKGHTVVNDNGLYIYDTSNKKRSQVDASGLNVFDTDGATSVALFGATARIGKSSTRHVEVEDGGMQVYQDSSNIMAHIGYSSGNAQSGTAIAPYFTFGTRIGSIGNYSLAGGYNVEASGYASHANGLSAKAKGKVSHAEGSMVVASGEDSHAEGNSCKAVGYCSHAEGFASQANKRCSHAEGDSVVADGECQTVIGRRNIADNTSAFIIGNGTGGVIATQSNALVVDWNGNMSIAGTLTQGSDRRLKEHISYLGDEAVDFINGLKPAHYTKDGEKHVGFYAQDVEAVDEWGCMTDEMNGYMTLGYMELLAPIVTYIQKLEKRIKELEEDK